MKTAFRIASILFLVGLTSCARTEIQTIRFDQQQSGTEASLRGLCAVNDQIAWASGSGNTVLRTVDGGATWDRLPAPDETTFDFRDIHAWDARTAVITTAGTPAKIYRTEDGGTTWTEVYADLRPGAFFDAMAFWDDMTGLVFGDPVEGHLTVIKTTDGGRTWRMIEGNAIPPIVEGEAGFAASGTCLAVTGKGSAWVGTGGPVARVFHSTDWGETWAVSETPIRHGSSSCGIFSLVFWDATHGMAVGGDYQNPEQMDANAAVTSDGSKTWTLIQEKPPNGFRSAVTVVPRAKGPMLVTAGPSGWDISRDGGRTWTLGDTTGYHAVSFGKKLESGWVSGGEGRIAKCVTE